ncbi:hypothetical protein [Devosia sediminis]|uniref:Uncharacterized protein n=1 Tax=Devosia sediminis TaxID=2798801 RepID=A0A934MJ74_9HYPH|nr:hypothetical protein [Devosia sediminis]MBJ3786992.1 hypothetical protein [Devosia sediminis]
MKANLQRADFVRVDHLQHAWHQALKERLDPHLSVEREERMFDLVASCDPTPAGRYLSWLSRWRRRNWDILGLRAMCGAGELAEVMAALQHFDRIRKFLPKGRGDVNTYHSAQDLFNAEGYIKGPGRRDLRRAERDVAMAGSEVLFDEGRWRLVLLRSQAAAAWWGMGTRWCTASRSDNRFELYARQGDLLVILSPCDRYQLSCATGEFRNSSDGHANLAQVLHRAPSAMRSILESKMGLRWETLTSRRVTELYFSLRSSDDTCHRDRASATG